MMSEYEEDLDDFPMHSTENTSEKDESLVGAYRVESTDQWTTEVELLLKFHNSPMG